VSILPLIRTELSDVPEPGSPLVLAIGSFDGFHLGHQQVIRTAGRHAKSLGARLGVLRFHPHPARVLRPEQAPPLLYTDAQADEVLASLGVDLHVRLPFTPELAALEPEDFLSHLHRCLPGLVQVVVGPNWRFGRQGRGDIHLLRDFATTHGFQVDIAPGTAWGESLVSSTRIREALQMGRMDEAATLLGRPYALTGIVREGKKLGRTLGFPTANFFPEQELLPPHGVYAMRVFLDGACLPGAGYITHVPRLAEVHLLDFTGDLYGQRLRADLIAFQRPAQTIQDPAVLRDTIARDVSSIRTLLSGKP
jgi:riboflavin kinase/FMN adenylyltransferase